MTRIFVVVWALALTGCGAAKIDERADARAEYQKSLDEYQACIDSNLKNLEKCEQNRVLMETNGRTYNALIAPGPFKALMPPTHQRHRRRQHYKQRHRRCQRGHRRRHNKPSPQSLSRLISGRHQRRYLSEFFEQPAGPSARRSGAAVSGEIVDARCSAADYYSLRWR
jgi:hypothetical protein